MITLNGKTLEVIQFPNGESLIKTEGLVLYSKNTIVLRYENDKDLMNLMFLKKHLDDRHGYGIESNLLVLAYMPYSRMDRTEGQNVFTLKHVANFINGLKFDCIVVLEPHSDVSVALLNRAITEDISKVLTEKLLEDIGFTDEDYICYPDAGAQKRYSKQLKYNNVLTANKERDFTTGHIKNLTMTASEVPTKPFKAVIVDDLCSKGGTFMLTAEKLKEMGATDIYLVVTHCENTIFDGDILKTDLIKGVYTTDSILTKEHEKLFVANVEELLGLNKEIED